LIVNNILGNEVEFQSAVGKRNIFLSTSRWRICADKENDFVEVRRVMKKLYLIFMVTIVLQMNGFAQTSFPLDIGNKWYYQAGSNRNEVYGIVREVTDTLSNGFREITSKYFSRTGVTTGKEYWGFIDGKFYANSYSPAIDYYAQVYYDKYLTHDSCLYIGGSNMANDCWKLTEYPMFNIIDSAQIYTRSGAIASIVSFQQTVIVSPKIGIIRTWSSSYPREGLGDRDSTYLIGMYMNGEVLGDTIFSNPYRRPPLFSPINGSHDIFLTVTLQWNKASEAISYSLQVSTDTSFGNLVVDYTELTDTFKVVGPLEDITEYYWRVGALSSDGKEYWSSYYNFRTINTRNIPYLLSPEDGAIIPQKSTFKWRKAEEGVSYYLQISTDPYFNNLVYGRLGLSDTTKTIDSLKLDTEYYWRVEATTMDQQSDIHFFFSQVFSFKVDHFGDPDRATSLVFPLKGSLTLPTVNLAWNKVPEAISYKLQVAKDIEFINMVLDFSGLKDTSKVIGPLEGLTKYFWRVGTISSNGIEYWSSYFNFTTINSQNITNLLLPFNGAANIAQPIIFKWSKVPGAWTYEFQIAADSLCHNTVLDRIVQYDTVQVIDSLVINKKYYWRVKKTGSDLYWSQIYSFTTEAAPIEFSLEQNYPNPFNGTTKFNYTLTIKTRITIQLYNVLGEKVKTLLDSEKEPGAYFLTVDAASLPSGIYFYQLRAGEFVQTKKMVLIR